MPSGCIRTPGWGSYGPRHNATWTRYNCSWRWEDQPAPEESRMSGVIETQSLAKNYGKFGALHGLNLSMPEGSVFALVGASGAGKTTTIKILLNIIAPTHASGRRPGGGPRRLRPPFPP